MVYIVTYYLLIKGDRVGNWLRRLDLSLASREFMEAVNKELDAVLFGNLFYLISSTIIAIIAFQAYNAFAQAGAHIPYPTLVGLLTGIASLIPVVGRKAVYVPLVTKLGIQTVFSSNGSPIRYVITLLIISILVVDTIPEIIIHRYRKGDVDNVGILLLSYTLGILMLGFYGLFVAPIILVVGIVVATITLPQIFATQEDIFAPTSAYDRNQLRHDDF